MKLKMHAVLTDPNLFLRGHYDFAFGLFETEQSVDDWTNCGEVEFDVDVDRGEVIAKVVNAINIQIDEERAQFTARMDVLESRKNELLALTHEVAT